MFNGWLTENAARRVVGLAGLELDELMAQAESRDFRPIPLGVRTSLRLTAQIRHQETANVLGIVPGSDPELKDEFVIFTAHHDHLGLAPARDASGDNVYNGAIDNASGVALLLTMLRELVSIQPRPRRSFLIAFVGAEEQGLLGSKYLAQHSPIHPGAISAVINIDGINFLGRTHDVNLISMGKSDLDELVVQVARAQGRTVVPDLDPDRGYYYRSDQFSFAQIGVPGVYLHSGIHVVGKPEGWGKQQLDRWVQEIYHQPADEYDDSWNLDGALEDGQLLLAVALLAANQSQMAQWYAGDEFAATREKALADREKKQQSMASPSP
ncbi:MAG: hypothetical protein KatS3mg111_3583 [Pirellulaceae bacterium]|nr:MAG: hypothetical protein KatS3mg111_3583 [Pirellulaceae bacterium]